MNKYDKYYTNNDIVKICCKLFDKYITINKNDLIIEPSAGNGAFIDCLNKYNNKLFYDIKPEHNNIIKKHILLHPPRHMHNAMSVIFYSEFCYPGEGWVGGRLEPPLPRSNNKL